MKYSQIRSIDISDGPGVRVGIYTQGCPFHCEGCWNEDTWDFNGGREIDDEVITEILSAASKEYICGISILGGEPLIHDNIDTLKQIVRLLKVIDASKTVWIWTGYLYENLDSKQMSLLKLCDVLVDGQFEEEKKDLNLKYRGSSNQRVIDLKKTIKSGKIVEWENK